MEREHEPFSLPERILARLLLRVVGCWFEHVGTKLKPEGQKAIQRIFKEILNSSDKSRDMSSDSKEIFAGFTRNFKGLENIPETGPVLFLFWHYPEGPLSFWGPPFWISEAAKERREDAVVLVGATRFRLSVKGGGSKLGRDLGRQIIENCYGGIYVNYGETNVEAVKKIIKALGDDQMVILAPDDFERTIVPSKEVGELKPEAVKLIAHLAEKIPELSIMAAVPHYFKETNTLALDFISIEGRPDNLGGWNELIKETLSTSVSP